jgi:LCP family protein required for cell wall assembly
MRITLEDSDFKKSPVNNRDIKNVNRQVSKRRLPKKKSSKTRLATKIIFGIVGILLAIFLSYGGYLLYKTYKAGTGIGLKLNPSDIFSKEVPTLKKDSTGTYTNALIVGIDTRENGNLLNTDSIILVSYNHKTNNVVMMSIPRDFHVQVDPDVQWFRKINSVYSTYEQREKDAGLLRLREVVTEITGHEIQYHAMIDYKGFTELIDTLGGIDVYVENSFTDYRFPAEPGYRTVSFQQGPQHMDGSTALDYARSRHSLDNGEGSDFARARRQQNVISAVTDKIISSSLLNPQSIMNLFNVIQDNVQISDFTVEDIKAGVTQLQKFQENGEIFSFVLDPNAGAGKLVTSKDVVNTNAYAIGPVAGLGNYESIREYIDDAWENPKLHEEDPIIRIYNTGLGYTETRQKYLDLVEQFPYLKIYYSGTLYNDKEGTISYINNESEEHLSSLESINQYIQPDQTEKPEYITTNLNNEDLTVLYGKEVNAEDNIQQNQ